jgi:xylan 1,4-beta-xylosidase
MSKVKGGRVFWIGVVMGIVAAFFCAQAANLTFTVTAGTKNGAWSHFYENGVASCHAYTLINSSFNRNIANALKIAHDSAGFQYHRCHGVLDDDVHPYVSAGSYNWTNMDTIFDRVRTAGMRPAVEISFMPGALWDGSGSLSLWYNNVAPHGGPPTNWTNWKNFITAMVQHLESRYGQAEVRNWLFEIWNEPDWMYTGWTPYLALYDSTAKAIKAADASLRVGGPACEGSWSRSAIVQFLDHCRSNGTTKPDFVSWHRYANDNDAPYSGSVSNPSAVSSYAKAIDSTITAYNSAHSNYFTGLNINDEYGPTYNTDHRDNHTAASFVVKTVHLIALNGSSYPPPWSLCYWAISDIYEEFNGTGQTAYRSSGQYGMLLTGDPSISQSWDVAKPVFNAYKLLHKLGDTLLSTSGGTTGDGANLLATLRHDQRTGVSQPCDTICVMTYTHHNGGGTAQQTDNIALTINGIPFTRMRIEHWVIDSTRSNSFYAWRSLGGPTNPTSGQWTTIAAAAQLAHYDSVKTDTTITSGTYTKAFTQNYYSVNLIRLSQIPSSGVSEPPKKVVDPIASMNAKIAGKNLLLDLPLSGQYAVQLYATNGQKILDKRISGPGKSSIALEKVPAGIYLVRCSSPLKTLTARVVIGR